MRNYIKKWLAPIALSLQQVFLFFIFIKNYVLDIFVYYFSFATFFFFFWI